MSIERETITPREFTGQFSCIQGKPCPQRHPRSNGDHGCTLWWEEDLLFNNGMETKRKIVDGCAGAVLKFSMEFVTDRVIDQNTIMEKTSQDIVNRVGHVVANNIDKAIPESTVRRLVQERVAKQEQLSLQE